MAMIVPSVHAIRIRMSFARLVDAALCAQFEMAPGRTRAKTKRIRVA